LVFSSELVHVGFASIPISRKHDVLLEILGHSNLRVCWVAAIFRPIIAPGTVVFGVQFCLPIFFQVKFFETLPSLQPELVRERFSLSVTPASFTLIRSAMIKALCERLFTDAVDQSESMYSLRSHVGCVPDRQILSKSGGAGCYTWRIYFTFVTTPGVDPTIMRPNSRFALVVVDRLCTHRERGSAWGARPGRRADLEVGGNVCPQGKSV